ncbi:MAG: hypothetical protein RMK29_13205, partial [Myxococcales bacterium]|nr:hypothetical protein [Myxococcales bacterium]
MFIENFLNALLRPFRELYSQWLRVRAIKGGIQGDVRRVQMLGQQVQNYGKSAAGYIQNAPGQVQQAMGFGGQQQVPQPVASHGSAGRTKMSWWPWGKKTCPGCNNKLHKSWDRCPYCGLSQRPGIPAG